MKMEPLTSVQQDNLRFITELELTPPLAEFASERGEGTTDLNLREGIEQSFLADKSLVSFVTNVSPQQRADILQSTLLAQLAANKRYPVENDMMSWYKEFAKVLSNLGWIIEGHEVTRFNTDERGAELDNVIIDVLTSAFGANYIAIIKKTLEAIKSLSNEDNRIVAFEKNTQSMDKGCFQLGVAVTENDAVSLRLGTFLLNSSKKITRILFFRIRKGETTIDYVSQKATFNPIAYDKIRAAVSTKIEKYLVDYVAELEI